jgi:predicted AlkP superfamily pyrophosphatase or phosphodiesterase
MRNAVRTTSLAVLVSAFALVATAVVRSQTSSGPKLLVVIAVDQMRGDYIEKYRHQWSGGLKRLVTEGAWFRQADYPYFNTVTCAGHASISTGTVPAVHGMVLNEWWEASSNKTVSCTEDTTQTLISYGAPVKGMGHSAARLMAPALADELRLQLSPAPRVVSISMKARSAINLGGRRPDVVTWLDDSGEWVTSTAFAKAPVPFVADYVRAHPMASELGRVWDRAMPADRYSGEDSTLGRHEPKIGSLGFPHTLSGKNGKVDISFSDAWESSPYADAFLAGFAASAIDALKLGQGPGLDYLSLSFAALDKVGHDFGPEAHEVQDVLYRLDGELAKLLDKLDRAVGRGRYTVALSADHGVSPTPERVSAMGFDAGRIRIGKLSATLEEALARELGPGKYVATIQHTDIYFRPGVYQRLVENPRALAVALEVVKSTPGVWRVYRKEDLLRARNDADPITRAAANSHFEGRSGDIVLLPRAYWITSTSTTTHGTGHRYDTRVPLVLFGQGIRPGQYLEPASPIDIAPTLGFLASVTLSDPMGRVLTEALEHGGRVSEH